MGVAILDARLEQYGLTEIDLLVSGRRELPSPVEELTEHSLIAWSSQARERSRHYWAWGWNRDEPLPTIALPLDYPNARSVDLAACYQQAYQTNRWPDRLELAEQAES